ncbi:DNRLRE domain-containing protein [bacterium]|nr:DNRLRE domain-containing protein [bacterium]
MKKIVICLIAVQALFVFQCTQKQSNPVGSSLLTDDEISQVGHRILVAAASDTSFHIPAETGTSDYLYFGGLDDIHARTLFLFSGIEDTADIDSAVVKLDIYRILHSGDLPATVNIYEITQAWESDGMTFGDFDESMAGNLIAQVTVQTDTLDSLRFSIDPDLVRTWMDTTGSGSNFGLLLDSDDGVMLQCYSRNVSASVSTGPQILVYFTGDSTRYPEITEASDDIFIAGSETVHGPGTLILENGIASRIFMTFDLSGFTRDMIINGAKIILTADTTLTLPETDAPTLTACTLDSSAALQDMECNSANVSYGSIENGLGTVDMTYQIQTMISEQLENYGILIEGTAESSLINRLVFYSTEADSAKKPRLEIYYTTPVGSTF